MTYLRSFPCEQVELVATGVAAGRTQVSRPPAWVALHIRGRSSLACKDIGCP